LLTECQTKQFVGVVKGKYGTFNVYETCNPQYYLFKPVVNGCETTLDIPTKKSDLKPEILRALRHGCGIDAS
jgi:hypothetical protein